MIKQIFSYIEEGKNFDVFLKRSRIFLMLGVSAAIIVIDLMHDFSNNRLYFATVFEGIYDKLNIHISILSTLTILAYIVGVRKILSSFDETNIERANANSAAGISLVFSAFFVSATFKFVNYLKHYNNIKIKPMELIGMAIFLAFAVIMILIEILKYKKDSKKMIFAAVEVALVIVAILFVFNFRFKVSSSIETGFVVYPLTGFKKLSFYSLPIFAFILVSLLTRKIYALITLEDSKSYASIYFLSAFAYVLCMVVLFIDVYDVRNRYEIIFKNLGDYVKEYLKCFSKTNYFGIGILLAGMIIAPIFKAISKEKKA